MLYPSYGKLKTQKANIDTNRPSHIILKCIAWPSPAESRLVCQQVIRIFYLLAQEEKIVGVTQDLLGLVTGVAQNLKTLIRLGLTDALRLVCLFFYPLVLISWTVIIFICLYYDFSLGTG